jgi:hypothetical protein
LPRGHYLYSPSTTRKFKESPGVSSLPLRWFGQDPSRAPPSSL